MPIYIMLQFFSTRMPVILSASVSDMEDPEVPKLIFETVDKMHNETELKPNCASGPWRVHLQRSWQQHFLVRSAEQTHAVPRLWSPVSLWALRQALWPSQHHTEHQCIHTAARPYTCDCCEWAFTTRHNLKRHQLIHDKEETYSCNVCDLLFCQEHHEQHEEHHEQIHPKLKYKDNQNMDQKKKTPQETWQRYFWKAEHQNPEDCLCHRGCDLKNIDYIGFPKYNLQHQPVELLL